MNTIEERKFVKRVTEATGVIFDPELLRIRLMHSNVGGSIKWILLVELE